MKDTITGLVFIAVMAIMFYVGSVHMESMISIMIGALTVSSAMAAIANVSYDVLVGTEAPRGAVRTCK